MVACSSVLIWPVVCADTPLSFFFLQDTVSFSFVVDSCLDEFVDASPSFVTRPHGCYQLRVCEWRSTWN